MFLANYIKSYIIIHGLLYILLINILYVAVCIPIKTRVFYIISFIYFPFDVQKLAKSLNSTKLHLSDFFVRLTIFESEVHNFQLIIGNDKTCSTKLV